MPDPSKLWCLEYSPIQRAFHLDELSRILKKNAQHLQYEHKCLHWVMLEVGDHDFCLQRLVFWRNVIAEPRSNDRAQQESTHERA